MTGLLRVVIADDHQLFRDGLAALLAADARFVVAASVCDGPSAVAMSEELHPDVVLLDASMPGASARVTVEQLRRRAPSARVIVLTMHEDRVLRDALLHAGAADFIHKSVSAPDLLVRLATPPAVSRPDVAEGLSSVSLSVREGEVLLLLAEALSNEDIAARLVIAPATVKRHALNIYRKLDVRSRMAAVEQGRRLGLLTNPALAEVSDEPTGGSRP